METSNACSCNSCVSACKHKPGWFKPGEAEAAASLVGMPLKEFFDKYLMADFWVNILPPDTYVLSPAVEDNAGKVAPFSAFGKCVFLEDDKCSIHEAKPFECKAYDHATSSQASYENHKEAGMAWLGHQDQIKELLGSDPTRPGLLTPASLLPIFP